MFKRSLFDNFSRKRVLVKKISGTTRAGGGQLPPAQHARVNNHVTATLERCQKTPKFCRSVSSLSHFLFQRDFLRTIADSDIIITPLEPYRPTDVHVGGYKTETKNLGGFLPQNRFLAVVAPLRIRINYIQKRGKLE